MLRDISYKLLTNTLKNYVKIKLNRNQLLEPLFFTFYNTLRCNFSCSYCEFAGNKGGQDSVSELDTQETMKLLQIVKNSCPNIYFTGGEPLLRSDIVDVVQFCCHIGFKSISVNTNMSLIHKRMEILDYINNLIASLDVVDENACVGYLGVSLKSAQRVKENIINCARLQKEKGFALTVNCVVIPETVRYVREVMDFCFEHDMRFAVVPAELEGGEINDRLLGNEEYQSLIKHIIRTKEEGKPVFGSKSYLKTILDFTRFECYPTLTPHIYPNGDLFYPCEPSRRVGANLLDAGSYKRALRRGIRRFGPLPFCKNKCYKACYIEPSIFMKNPFLILGEAI